MKWGVLIEIYLIPKNALSISGGRINHTVKDVLVTRKDLEILGKTVEVIIEIITFTDFIATSGML